MERSSRGFATAVAAAAMLAVGCGRGGAPPPATASHPAPSSAPVARAPVVSTEELTAGRTRLDDAAFGRLVRDAYVYAYPYVLMDVTREVMTTSPGPGHAPTNQIAHVRDLSTPTMHEVVRLNLDTLYSSAWLDLGQGPMVISVPDTHGRYYVLQVMDAATNVVASIGKRTTGTARGAFAIVGPGFAGTLPANVQRVDAPTNTVWLAGRIRVVGRSDVASVRRIQSQIRLTPSSEYGRLAETPALTPLALPATAPSETPVRRVESMAADEYFTRFASVLSKNPPPADDAAFLARLAPMGITPGDAFDARPVARRVGVTARSMSVARRQILAGDGAAKTEHGGWTVYGLGGAPMGTYGTDYATRATIARTALGANLPKDALYPMAKTDSSGAALDGAHRYRLHFAADALPPADEFWSLTAYDAEGYIAANERRRYAIGDRDYLRRNADGSLDLYLGHDSPGRAYESNWLPTPDGTFDVTLRVYGPRTAMLEGRWLPAPIERLD